MPEIRIEHVSKRFGGFTAVDDLHTTFADGTVTCLLGPSGCGKTTLMRMIAGLETPTEGRIRFGDRDVTDLPARKRNVGMVFQYPVMYPTLNVVENIELPLRNDRKVSAEERRRRVEEVMGILRLGSLAERFIGELDAGTRQKVAVGRAVARHSEIILFDEPTTNVEVNAKLQLIRAFKEVARRLQQTIVYVTHDQTEAMTLADRIALMKDGKIVQCAAPRVLFDEPETDFGGWFLGNPGMNFVEGSVRAGHVESPILASPLPAAGPDGAVRVGVRPERLRLHASPQPGTVPATVFDRSLAIGGRFLLRLRLAGSGGEVKAKAPGHAAPPLGATVHVECPQDAVTVFRDGWRGEGAGPMREIA